MPSIGYRHWCLRNGSEYPFTTADTAFIADYFRPRGHSFIIARHNNHVHVVGYESSGSSGFRQYFLRGFPFWTASSRILRCYNCARVYLLQQWREVDFLHQDEDSPPRCERTLHEVVRSDDGQQIDGVSSDDLCSLSSPEGADDDPEDGPSRKRARVGEETGYTCKSGGAFTKRISEAIQALLPQSLTELSEFFANNNELGIVAHKDFTRVSSSMLDAVRASYRKRPWIDIMNSIPPDYFSDDCLLSVDESLDWFHKILEFNNINPKSFLTDAFNVMDKNYPKKNTLLVLGPPNSGKTLIFSSLCKSAIFFSSAQNFTGNSSFEFQDLLSCRCALINEPMITDKTVETMKNILEGNPTAIDKKYASAQLLPRTPIFITTNASLCYYTTNRSVNKAAILARTFCYDFKAMPELKECAAQLSPYMWLDLYNMYIQ